MGFADSDPDRPRPAPASESRPADAAAPAPRELIVNRTSTETRVALIESGRLTEVFIERDENRSLVGNIYKGRVAKILPGMQSAFVSIGLIRDAFLHVHDVVDPEGEEEENAGAAPPGIEDLLQEGQDLLVQLTKEPILGKGARITTNVTLPGRRLVLIPAMSRVGVSRRIEDPDERARLRTLVSSLRREQTGFIVRTAAQGATAEDFASDLRYLSRLWEEILRRSGVAPPGTLLNAEFDPVRRVLRDLFSDEFIRIVVDDRLTHQHCVDFLETLRPGVATRVEYYTDDLPIFDRFGIQEELDRALRGRVWLRSGGFIVINQTEALVAIDVNTGKFVGKHRLEETVLQTNLEAVFEVVRQIRLRDLAGIIVVDFIDMEEESSKRKVLEALHRELGRDRARTNLLQISDFGLVEITRQRSRRSLERTLCRPCPYCSGSGRTKTPQTVLFEIQREIQRIGPQLEGNRLVIRVHPEVADRIEDRRHRFLEVLPPGRRFELALERDPALHQEEFDILNLPGSR